MFYVILSQHIINYGSFTNHSSENYLTFSSVENSEHTFKSELWKYKTFGIVIIYFFFPPNKSRLVLDLNCFCNGTDYVYWVFSAMIMQLKINYYLLLEMCVTSWQFLCQCNSSVYINVYTRLNFTEIEISSDYQSEVTPFAKNSIFNSRYVLRRDPIYPIPRCFRST